MDMINSLLSEAIGTVFFKAAMVHDPGPLVGAPPHIASASGKFMQACAISRLGLQIG
ncbi:hypothetical protein [Rhodoferax sp.]|uniref:hypothetical protein n=1 Tax=Rhodoferax sp. TaxID=50421 RepID=UPI003BB6261D